MVRNSYYHQPRLSLQPWVDYCPGALKAPAAPPIRTSRPALNMFAHNNLGGAMSAVGTIRLFRPAPDTASEPERCGRATFAVCHPSAARIQIDARGEIDAVNGRAFGRYVERHTGASRQLILDLRAVDFFGSQGFTALYYVSVHCARSDVDWIVVGSPAVRTILRICDPDGELPAVTHLDAAFERLDRLAMSRHRN